MLLPRPSGTNHLPFLGPRTGTVITFSPLSETLIIFPTYFDSANGANSSLPSYMHPSLWSCGSVSSLYTGRIIHQDQPIRLLEPEPHKLAPVPSRKASPVLETPVGDHQSAVRLTDQQ